MNFIPIYLDIGTSRSVPDGSNIIHKIAALAFLGASFVINGFEHLSVNLGDDYKEIIDYVEGTYMGS